MPSPDRAGTSTLVIALKVLVSLAPGFVLQQLCESHAKLAYGVGLIMGAAVAWFCVPPRGKAKDFLVLLACVIILSIVRLMLP